MTLRLQIGAGESGVREEDELVCCDGDGGVVEALWHGDMPWSEAAGSCMSVHDVQCNDVCMGWYQSSRCSRVLHLSWGFWL